MLYFGAENALAHMLNGEVGSLPHGQLHPVLDQVRRHREKASRREAMEAESV